MTRPAPLAPVIGLMLGDATGIGPEQCARVLADKRLADAARLVVVGDARVLMQGARDAGVTLTWRSYAEPEDIPWTGEEVPLIELGNLDPAEVIRGTVCPNAGRAAAETLQHMAELAALRRLEAITFAPISKAALDAGGLRFDDEHQMLASLARHHGFFAGISLVENVWICSATAPAPLRQAVADLTPQRVGEALSMLDATMRAAGIARPRIGVCALNPLPGPEESDVIGPAVSAAVQDGIACEGPFPADRLFARAFAGELDAVLAMHQDQARIAVRLRGLKRGVTVTAGMDVIFTTPAHGTAFDIVGKGVASTTALEQAVRLAARLASARRPKG